MDVFDLRRNLVSDYRDYTRSFIKIRDAKIKGYFDDILEAEGFWPEPLLQLNPTFRSGGTIKESERLLTAHPEGNLLRTAIEQQLGLILPSLPKLRAALETVAHEQATAQLGAHERVRTASRAKERVDIEPVLPVDFLGAYVLLPLLPAVREPA